MAGKEGTDRVDLKKSVTVTKKGFVKHHPKTTLTFAMFDHWSSDFKTYVDVKQLQTKQGHSLSLLTLRERTHKSRFQQTFNVIHVIPLSGELWWGHKAKGKYSSTGSEKNLQKHDCTGLQTTDLILIISAILWKEDILVDQLRLSLWPECGLTVRSLNTSLVYVEKSKSKRRRKLSSHNTPHPGRAQHFQSMPIGGQTRRVQARRHWIIVFSWHQSSYLES